MTLTAAANRAVPLLDKSVTRSKTMVVDILKSEEGRRRSRSTIFFKLRSEEAAPAVQHGDASTNHRANPSCCKGHHHCTEYQKIENVTDHSSPDFKSN
jgi:hypothetical protein